MFFEAARIIMRDNYVELDPLEHDNNFAIVVNNKEDADVISQPTAYTAYLKNLALSCSLVLNNN